MTGPAAAKWVAAAHAGQVVGKVVLLLAATGAGAVVDGPALRWRRHPGGWVDGFDLGSSYAVVVGPDHEWAGRDGVQVVPAGQVAPRTVDAVVEAVRPLVEACHRLARVGRTALWAEVVDGVTALGQVRGVPVSAQVRDALDAALRVPGAPWRRVPTVAVVPAPDGPVWVARRAGCCLVYQCAGAADDVAPAGPYAAFRTAYRARFPRAPGEPLLCSSCSLQPFEECAARQVFAHEHRHLLPDRVEQP